MTLTAIEQVRLKTSDQPIFVREEQIQGNGVDAYFKLNHNDILASPAPVVYKNGVIVLVADYTLSGTTGSITFDTIPASGDDIVVEYWTIVYTDAEVEQFLLDAGGNTTYAAAINLLAWAAHASKLAKKETLAGGGGRGDVTLDLAVTAEQLRKTAQVYLNHYKEMAIDDNFGPADGITEVPWTEHSYQQIYGQSVIRESDA